MDLKYQIVSNLELLLQSSREKVRKTVQGESHHQANRISPKSIFVTTLFTIDVSALNALNANAAYTRLPQEFDVVKGREWT